jgi:hypothetical protein
MPAASRWHASSAAPLPLAQAGACGISVCRARRCLDSEFKVRRVAGLNLALRLALALAAAGTGSGLSLSLTCQPQRCHAGGTRPRRRCHRSGGRGPRSRCTRTPRVRVLAVIMHRIMAWRKTMSLRDRDPQWMSQGASQTRDSDRRGKDGKDEAGKVAFAIKKQFRCERC